VDELHEDLEIVHSGGAKLLHAFARQHEIRRRWIEDIEAEGTVPN
jgi:hypothetical protein